MRAEWYTQRDPEGHLYVRLNIAYRAANETSSGSSWRVACFIKKIWQHEFPIRRDKLKAIILDLTTSARKEGFRI